MLLHSCYILYDSQNDLGDTQGELREIIVAFEQYVADWHQLVKHVLMLEVT